MAEAEHHLGLAERLQAEALGVPGQRRFRILVDGPGGSAVLWLEKEDLQRLALAVARLLEMIADEGRKEATSAAPSASSARVSLDFQASGWSIGYDERWDALEFVAHGLEEEATPPKVRFWATREQGRYLSEEALRVYAAGRPTCPLCGAALNPGEDHVCPRGNGHLGA